MKNAAIYLISTLLVTGLTMSANAQTATDTSGSGGKTNTEAKAAASANKDADSEDKAAAASQVMNRPATTVNTSANRSTKRSLRCRTGRTCKAGRQTQY